MPTQNNALIVFLKNPELGKVKTRLAKTVGDAKALEIYLELLNITQRTVEKIAQNDVTCYPFYSDYITSESGQYLQKGDDLGARMNNAFDLVFNSHNKVCIMGSDCPTLSVNIIEQAFDLLDSYDCVIGPSSDGGYYLLGLRQNTEGVPHSKFQIPSSILKYSKEDSQIKKSTDWSFLFNDMSWSIDTVFTETVKRLEAQGKSYSLLPILTDIDEEKDWIDYLNR